MRRLLLCLLAASMIALPLRSAFAHPCQTQPCDHDAQSAAAMDCCDSALSGDKDAPVQCHCAPGAACHSGAATVFWATPSSPVSAADAARVGAVPDRAVPFSSVVLAVPIRPPVAGV